MTARSARFVIDTQALKPTEVLRRVARAGTAVGLTHRLLRDLEQELGGCTRACSWLINLATATGLPITITVPTRPDTSTTVVIASKGWSDERLRGWIGGMHEELEATFGHDPGLGDGIRLMSARPYRQCPACGVVRAGSEFKRAPRSGTFGAPAHRRCPACGHVALRTAFPQVKRPLAGESAEDVD